MLFLRTTKIPKRDTSRQMDMQSRSLTHKILDTGMITVGQNGGRFLINMVLKLLGKEPLPYVTAMDPELRLLEIEQQYNYMKTKQDLMDQYAPSANEPAFQEEPTDEVKDKAIPSYADNNVPIMTTKTKAKTSKVVDKLVRGEEMTNEDWSLLTRDHMDFILNCANPDLQQLLALSNIELQKRLDGKKEWEVEPSKNKDKGLVQELTEDFIQDMAIKPVTGLAV